MCIQHFSQFWDLQFVSFSGIALSVQRRYHEAITNKRRKHGAHTGGIS
nr:MAG TPA: hypothetical protein [Caudoviricetes sp.]